MSLDPRFLLVAVSDNLSVYPRSLKGRYVIISSSPAANNTWHLASAEMRNGVMTSRPSPLLGMLTSTGCVVSFGQIGRYFQTDPSNRGPVTGDGHR